MYDTEKKLLETLNECIENTTKNFSHYQILPAEIIDRFGDKITSNYLPEQLSLDAARLEFLTTQFPVSEKQICEIGSNLGYFCLSLAERYGCIVTGYEPICEYARASTAMAQLLNLEKTATFEPHGILLNELRNIPKCDFLIELNVLHHAGAVYDVADASGNWDLYAIERLSYMRDRSEFLFFQTGNMCKGEALFSSVDAVTHMADIIVKAGWKIRSIGMITDFSQEILEYETFSVDNIGTVPTFRCQRNDRTGLVDYYNLDGTKKASLLTGLANRPLWVCS